MFYFPIGGALTAKPVGDTSYGGEILLPSYEELFVDSLKQFEYSKSRNDKPLLDRLTVQALRNTLSPQLYTEQIQEFLLALHNQSDWRVERFRSGDPTQSYTRPMSMGEMIMRSSRMKSIHDAVVNDEEVTPNPYGRARSRGYARTEVAGGTSGISNGVSYNRWVHVTHNAAKYPCPSLTVPKRSPVSKEIFPQHWMSKTRRFVLQGLYSRSQDLKEQICLEDLLSMYQENWVEPGLPPILKAASVVDFMISAILLAYKLPANFRDHLAIALRGVRAVSVYYSENPRRMDHFPYPIGDVAVLASFLTEHFQNPTPVEVSVRDHQENHTWQTEAPNVDVLLGAHIIPDSDMITLTIGDVQVGMNYAGRLSIKDQRGVSVVTLSSLARSTHGTPQGSRMENIVPLPYSTRSNEANRIGRQVSAEEYRDPAKEMVIAAMTACKNSGFRNVSELIESLIVTSRVSGAQIPGVSSIWTFQKTGSREWTRAVGVVPVNVVMEPNMASHVQHTRLEFDLDRGTETVHVILRLEQDAYSTSGPMIANPSDQLAFHKVLKASLEVRVTTQVGGGAYCGGTEFEFRPD